MSRPSFGRALSAGLLSTCTLAAPALGDPADRAVLIVDPQNEVSMYLANVYADARGLPIGSTIYMRPDADNYPSFVGFNIAALLGELQRRGRLDRTDFVLVAPTSRTLAFRVPASGFVNDQCPPDTSRFSVSGAYTMAFQSQQILGGGLSGTQRSEFWAYAGQGAIPLRSSRTYLLGSPTTGPGDRYFVGAMLGYTGGRGNTPEELIAMFERSAGADGTNPSGGFYFMRTGDQARSGPREPLFGAAISQLQQLGAAAFDRNGVLPPAGSVCAGILTGAASTGIATSGVQLIAGSFGDSLTSWGATFDIGQQEKVSAWIGAGASGSFGTVEEPCNFSGKFPSARAHPFYREGLTMGEAVFRSLQFRPYQGLLYGDALTRPWAAIPSVTVAGPKHRNLQFPLLQLPYSASATRPGVSIGQIDVLIDGVLVKTIGNGAPLALQLFGINDGWHEVRLVARENSTLETEGSWVGSFTLNTKGTTIEASAAQTQGCRRTKFVFEYNISTPGAIEARLVHGSRVLDASPKGSGIFEAYGNDIGAGPARVQVEALLADGTVVRGAPIELDITFDSGGASGAAPRAVSFIASMVDGSGPRLINLPSKGDINPGVRNFAILEISNGFTASLGPGGVCLVTPAAGQSNNGRLRYRVMNGAGPAFEGTVTLMLKPFSLDRNGDGVVDTEDLYAQMESPADLNGDGVTNGADALLLETLLRFSELSDSAEGRR